MTTRKRENTEVRQQQITEAALRIIGEKGVNGATTAEIAKAVGISEGNIYRHFKNKEEIIKSVIDKIGNDLRSILDGAKDINGPLEKLEGIFKRHIAYVKSSEGIPRTIFSEEVMVLQGELRKRVRSNLMFYYKGVRETVMHGQELGEINKRLNAKVITSMFIGTLNFTVIRWVLSDFSLNLKNEGEILWGTFVKCIAEKGPHSIKGIEGNRK